MKNVTEKPLDLDLDPETISTITEEEGEGLGGGVSCGIASCNGPQTKASAEVD